MTALIPLPNFTGMNTAGSGPSIEFPISIVCLLFFGTISLAQTPENFNRNNYLKELQELRIPVDFAEILSVLAPRPLLVISPSLDRHADLDAVKASVATAASNYQYVNASDQFTHAIPKSYNRFTREQQQQLVNWISEKANPKK